MMNKRTEVASTQENGTPLAVEDGERGRQMHRPCSRWRRQRPGGKL